MRGLRRKGTSGHPVTRDQARAILTAAKLHDDRATAIRLRACELMERMTGMPSYLVDHETAAAAYAQAEAEYVESAPLSPVQEAVRKAQGKNPTADEIAASIAFLNRAAAVMKRRSS